MEIALFAAFIVFILFKIADLMAGTNNLSSKTRNSTSLNNKPQVCLHKNWTTYDPGVFKGYPYLICIDCGNTLPTPKMPF